MTTFPDTRSIIAIDPTSRGLAFVLFENGEVLNWGERLRSPHKDELQAVEQLIGVCGPDVIVLENSTVAGCRRRARIRALLQAIAERARPQATVIQIEREAVRRAWAARGVTNKEAMAVVIAQMFPTLAIALPPRRKRGANEDPRVNIFDAASLAIHAVDRPPVVP